MRRAGTSLLLLLTVLAGCGEDEPFADYCEEVKSQQKPLTEAAAQQDTLGLIAALPSFEALQAKSPDDLTDEWAVVTKRIQVLVDALEEADVDPATYDREEPPEGLSEEDRAAIDAAARELASPAMVVALEGVQQQARDVCKTALSL